MKIPSTVFLEESMLFLLALKLNLSEKVYSTVKTKTNQNFAVKLAKRSNHSFLRKSQEILKSGNLRAAILYFIARLFRENFCCRRV